MRGHTAIAMGVGALLWGAARGDPFPAREGGSGLLDVPGAESVDLGGAKLGLELQVEQARGAPIAVGPSPVAICLGLGSRFELALALREGGLPGDPLPAPLLLSSGLKYQLIDARDLRPALAVDATLDRINRKPVGGVRLVASTQRVGRVSFAAFLGAEADSSTAGPTGGLAASILHRSNTEAVIEALGGPWGAMLGAALRWAFTPKAGVLLSFGWLPSDHAFRVGVGLALATPAPQRPRPELEGQTAPIPAPGPKAPEPGAPVFKDEQPHFRLKMKPADGGAP